MPDSSGYQPLAQTDEEERVGEVGNGSQIPPQGARARGSRRQARPGPIDLSKLDQAFKRWTEKIAQRVGKKKKRPDDNARKEIWKSVLEPHVDITSISTSIVRTLDHNPPMTQGEFEVLETSVRRAISEGINPKMISKGSSGSYFARAKIDGRVKVVAVFKPKDEEPYGRLNPKTTKWLHRQLRWIIPFGRSCLIPNLSYISEAAASLLDERLQLNIVPRTQLVSLSSPAFFYDWIDRNGAKKGKPLPEKIGSMQYFLHGYQDASEFLRKHPWPGRSIADTFDDDPHRTGNVTKRMLNAVKILCGRTGTEDNVFDEADQEDERLLFDATEENEAGKAFYWSQALQQDFREELEKLVILDYLMLNTDRGADNYMIKYCPGESEKILVDVAPSRSAQLEMPLMNERRRNDTSSSLPNHAGQSQSSIPGSSRIGGDFRKHPHIHIAAIDNSLSFPHEHPKGWRSYTYGWLYLPVTIIGRPFSQMTRDHFLPLLTSKSWWEETTFQLRQLFAVDPDFHPKMFRRQLAVMKGQAWTIIQSLKHSDEGPLELTRRQKMLVWDDEIEIEDEAEDLDVFPNGPLSASPKPSVNTMPLPQRMRSRSLSSDFPPPIRRTSTDATGAYRPVPFSSKFYRVHPGTTGVTALEHLEKLDAVEAGLQRLGMEDDIIHEEDEEGDVGESSTLPPGLLLDHSPIEPSSAPADQSSPIGSPRGLTSVPELSSSTASIAEEDIVALSKSTSHFEGAPRSHWTSHHPSNIHGHSFDWMQTEEAPAKRTVVVERLETVNARPLFSC